MASAGGAWRAVARAGAGPRTWDSACGPRPMVQSGVRGVWPRPSTHARATPAPGGHRSDPRGPTRAVSPIDHFPIDSTPSPGFRPRGGTKSRQTLALLTRPAHRPEHERQFSSCVVYSSTAPAALLSALNTPTSSTRRSAHTASSACYRTVSPRGPPPTRSAVPVAPARPVHVAVHGPTRASPPAPPDPAWTHSPARARDTTREHRYDRSSRLKDVP